MAQLSARVTSASARPLARLLAAPLGLDVWERHRSSVVVAAPESRLADVEHRRRPRGMLLR
jgi:hypothetical protein